MKRIIIDMDDVIADTTQKFCDMYKTEFGKTLEKHDFLGREFYEAIPLEDRKFVLEYHYQLGFFRDIAVIPHSQEVISRLMTKYEVYIATAAMEFPNSFRDKYDWMKEHFPFISWHNIIFCGDKHVLKGDYMIDDRLKNLKTFDGKSIVFTAPHNLRDDYAPFTRANNWLDIEKMLM
jgi:5'(3')-deoxyribonucleotidase